MKIEQSSLGPRGTEEGLLSQQWLLPRRRRVREVEAGLVVVEN